MTRGVSIPIFLIGVVVATGVFAPVAGAAPAAADADPLPPAAASGTDGVAPTEQASAEAAGPETTISVARTDDGTVEYTLDLSNLGTSNRLWLVLRGPVTVVSADGFERTTRDGVTRLSLVEDRSSASVTLASARDPATSDDVAVSDAWTFTRTPFVELQWVSDGDFERSWPLAERTSPDSGEPAVLGARYAVVGDFQTVRRSTPTGTIDLVVPEGVMSEAQTQRVGDALVRAARDLDVGDRTDAMLAFAAPSSVRWGGESVPVRDEFWVNSESKLASPEAVWLHEYVHTRQSFRLAPDMQWFREASAEYYAAQVSHEQGLVDERAMERHLDGPPASATLTDPDSWSGQHVPQRKGARVLALLDQRIREATYGQRSLDAVFRRLNRHEGVVTYDVFAQAVAEVTGVPNQAWLDRHVDGSAPVDAQYGPDARPLGAAVLASFGVGDALTPSMTAGASGSPTGAFGGLHGAGTAFFLIAIGFSVVASVPLYGALRRREQRAMAEGDAERSPSGWTKLS